MIKFLTQKELPTCAAISLLKSRVGGTVPHSIEDFYTSFEQYFGNDNRRVALGYFENDILTSFLFVSMFENKTRNKFWAIPGLYTKQFNNQFTFKIAGFGELIKFAFLHTESQGWYEYYYCIAERVMNAYERQWHRNNIMPAGRYELILLDKVPPNTQPETELYWKLMGMQLKSDTMVFKKRVLKPEFRKV